MGLSGWEADPRPARQDEGKISGGEPAASEIGCKSGQIAKHPIQFTLLWGCCSTCNFGFQDPFFSTVIIADCQ